jgi:hypothetical protein
MGSSTLRSPKSLAEPCVGWRSSFGFFLPLSPPTEAVVVATRSVQRNAWYVRYVMRNGTISTGFSFFSPPLLLWILAKLASQTADGNCGAFWWCPTDGRGGSNNAICPDIAGRHLIVIVPSMPVAALVRCAMHFCVLSPER